MMWLLVWTFVWIVGIVGIATFKGMWVVLPIILLGILGLMAVEELSDLYL